MLPSSHNEPIITSLLKSASDEVSRNMLDTATETRSSAAYLAEAFAEFVATSSRLEGSYRQLQGEVSGLRTELAERNAALKASLSDNQRVRLALQQIVDTMPCGILVVDLNGQISTINPESVQMLGIDAASDLPRTLNEIAALSTLQIASAAQADDEAEQELCIRSSNSERWLQIRQRQLQHESADGKSGQTIFILRDITAHKRAEREREATRNAVALAEITTMLAHEIRNPLASLELFAELIEQDGDPDGEWISNLRAGIRSLAGTVNNVLSLHDSRSLKLAPVVLEDIVTSTVRFIQPLADQAGVSVLWNSSHCDSNLIGNDGALQQVLLNLIKNAIRHTPAGGTVAVTLRPAAEPQRLLLECCDSGSGIRADQIARLFEPGFSGSGDTPGLGLAVCDRIVKQHGGRISVSNVPGSGACFSVELPVLLQENAQVSAQEQTA